MFFYQRLLEKIYSLERKLKEDDSYGRLKTPWVLTMPETFDILKFGFYQILLALVRFFLILKNSPASNFMILAGGPNEVSLHQYSYCQYKVFHHKVKKRSLISLTALVLILALILNLTAPGGLRAATYSWTQTDWGGGLDNAPPYPNHSSNQSGWTKYSAADPFIGTGGSNLKESIQSTSFAETSDTDFDDVGLVGAWSLDEGSGATFSDSSGNGNTGTYNRLSNGTYQYGGSLSFNGTSQYVNVPDSATLKISSAISVEAWVKLNNLTAVQVILVKTSEYLLRYDGSNTFAFYLYSPAAGNWEPHASYVVSGLNTNTWYHIVGTWNGTTQKIYVNGDNAPASATITHSFAPSGTTNAVNVGYWVLGGGYFNGNITEVRKYDRVLSAAEVSAHFNGTYSDNTSLQALWPFNEGAGQTVIDRSGNNNNGTLGANSSVASDDPVWSADVSTPSNIWTTAKYGASALNFDGVDDYVDLGSSGALVPSSALTISVWVKPNASRRSMIVTRDASANVGSYLLGLSDTSPVDNKVWFTVFKSTTPWVISQITSNTVLTVDGSRWYHIVAVYTGTTMSLYIDGVLDVGPVSSGSVDSINQDAGTTRIGGRNYTGYTDTFPGAIDEARIYNRALTSSEITNLYNNTPVYPRLAGYWNFDENTGTTAADTHHLVGSSGAKYGAALNFDGADDYVSVSDSSSLDITNL